LKDSDIGPGEDDIEVFIGFGSWFPASRRLPRTTQNTPYVHDHKPSIIGMMEGETMANHILPIKYAGFL